MVYIPYKGSAPSVTDLLAGATQWTIDGMTIVGPARPGRPAAAAGGGERAALAGRCHRCRP